MLYADSEVKMTNTGHAKKSVPHCINAWLFVCSQEPYDEAYLAFGFSCTTVVPR